MHARVNFAVFAIFQINRKASCALSIRRIGRMRRRERGNVLWLWQTRERVGRVANSELLELQRLVFIIRILLVNSWCERCSRCA
jgi:hypothetical protein